MKRLMTSSKHEQQGATLVVGLIMLVLITLLVTSAFTMSSSNIKSVGNMQIRNEAVAAANRAIEQIVSSPFTNAPAAESIDVDLDNDGNTDYTVNFSAPTCVSATEIESAGGPPSSVLLGGAFAVLANKFYQTVWDLNGVVTDPASGASVQVHQGVRVLLSQVQYNAVCS
jgi:hypothetical protein